MLLYLKLADWIAHTQQCFVTGRTVVDSRVTLIISMHTLCFYKLENIVFSKVRIAPSQRNVDAMRAKN